MKKLMINCSFIMLIIIKLNLMVACSSSDEDNITNSSANEKHITMVESIRNNASRKDYFTYDAEGKVIGLRTVSSGSSNYTYTIAYSPEMIKISSRANNYCEYFLLNGRIVSAHDGYNRDYSYTYDNNNNLISCTEPWITYSFIWNNGNITKMVYSHSSDVYETYIEYSNIRCPQNYIFSIELGFPSFSGQLYGVQWFLMAEGYFGNKPRNLPKSINGMECKRTLDADGYPVSVQIEDDVYNLTWN